MYGLPARDLTDEEEFLLDHCMPYAEARLTHIQVQAARIAAGQVGTPEYYSLDCPDEKTARDAYENALVSAALKRAHRG